MNDSHNSSAADAAKDKTINLFGSVSIALTISTKEKGSKGMKIGACVYQRLPRKDMSDKIRFSLTVFDFLDGEQYSNLDAFLVQYNSGRITLYLSEDLDTDNNENNSNLKSQGKKLNALLYSRVNTDHIEVKYCKRSLFTKSIDSTSSTKQTLLALVHGCNGSNPTHNINVADVQAPLGYACIDVLVKQLELRDGDEETSGAFTFDIGSLARYMRIDSAAAEAVNLLPKPDHPSQYGSIFGVLNRCKSKMGSRLLERWLRQPLLDRKEIDARLDCVELLRESTAARDSLQSGALKGLPDVDAIIAKISQTGASGAKVSPKGSPKSKKEAGLKEVFQLYTFTKSLVELRDGLIELVVEGEESSQNQNGDGEYSHMGQQKQTTERMLLAPLKELAEKFQVYQQLVEHVIDFNQLPDYVVNAQFDAGLLELKEEKDDLNRKAHGILRTAQSTYASFADVKLDSSGVRTFFLRTTKQDDERQLRANNKHVNILSLQKNGVHFTTDDLEAISERTDAITREYHEKQRGIVANAITTAATYMPLAEAASALVATIDVLTGFAVAAAYSSAPYVRPTLTSPEAAGGIDVKGGRHPCVELMDSVSNFIPNDYELKRDQKNFQIVTGPNMGGKSTYIRAIGSLCVMAQIGSFVPADSMTLSPCDCVLARVGAGDAVQKGVSTFMAEMLEASVILQTATKDSLIIIDELGRGTSTFDGFGIAWAISEYVINKLGCFTLFATHFHELTALERKYPQHVCNKHVSAVVSSGGAGGGSTNVAAVTPALKANNAREAREQEGLPSVTMLYAVKDGACNESFGIHIANTACFPPSVIEEAKRKAHELESNNAEEGLGTEAGQKKHKGVHDKLEGFFAEGTFGVQGGLTAECQKYAQDNVTASGKVRVVVSPGPVGAQVSKELKETFNAYA